MVLRTRYAGYLAAAGYGSTVDDAGDLSFEVDGHTFYLIIDDDDPCYFRLLLPNFCGLADAPTCDRASAAAAEVCAEIKVAKVYVHAGEVSAAAEMFLADPSDMPKVFPRALRVVQGAVTRFGELMRRRRLHLVHSSG